MSRLLTVNRLAAATSLCAALLWTTNAFGQTPPRFGGADQIFTEYFDQPAPGPAWTINSQVQDLSFRWQRAGEQPGFHYYNYGHGYGYATWNIGAQPFDLKFDTVLTAGILHEYVRNGVFVALSTNPPDSQGPNDISAVLAVQGAGPGASVRKGQLFVKDTELSNVSKWPIGGDVDSIAWPNTEIIGTQVTLEMQRLPNNTMVFSFYRPDYQGGLVPWWTASWVMPASVANTAFTTLIVETLNTDPTANAPTSAYGYQGVVSNIRGYVTGSEFPPTVTTAMPADQPVYQGGTTVTVNGQGFQQGCTVWLGGQYVTTTYISSTQLSVVLPTLPVGNYVLKVINPSGLEGQIPAGITYAGPTVLSMQPREASPAGGDIVTVVGAGFDSNTQVTIGGQSAPVVQLVDSFHLQVQAPAAASPGIAKVVVTGTNGVFAGSPQFGYSAHPYLYFGANGLGALQQKFNDPTYADYRTIILRNATDANPNNPQGAVGDYLWAYLFTGDPQIRSSLFTQIAKELVRIDFTDFRLTDAGIMATAYDSLFPELTPQQRSDFLGYLDRAYTVYNQMRADGAWFLGLVGGNVSNTTAVGNAGGGLVTLAINYSTPNTAPVITDVIKRLLPFASQCIGPDGGDVEGTLYWSYGLTWYLQFGNVLKTAMGDDRGLLTQPNLAKNYRFVESTWAGNNRYVTFNDSEPELFGLAVSSYLGTRDSQPLFLWMTDYLVHQLAQQTTENEASRYDIVPYAFLWRGSTAAPATFPGLPTSSVLNSMNWGILRSTGDLQPNLVVAVKGANGVITHHAQNDLGSFSLQAGGEEFFIDPGYYQPAATQHSLPFVDGASPLTVGSIITNVSDQGNIRTMTLDSSKAYGTKAQRVRRVVVLYRDQAAVVLDDIAPAAGSPGSVSSLFQTGNLTTVTSDPGLLVKGAQTQVKATFFGPAPKVATKGPVDFGNSWIYKANNVRWFSSTVTYTADPNTPLITVFSPSGAAGSGLTATVTYTSGQATVTFSDGTAITFTLGSSGWSM